MTTLRIRSVMLALGVVGALIVPILGLASPASADSRTRTPEVGECFDLSKAQVGASSWPKKARAVDCAELHTAEVAKVIDVPASVAKFGLKSRELNIWIEEECTIAINRYAGLRKPATAPETSTTKIWTFAPTAKEWKSGGRSATCVAGSVEPKYRKEQGWVLNPVKGSTKGKIGSQLEDVGTTDEWITYYYLRARAMLAKSLTQPYPGEEQLRVLADKKCYKALKYREGVVFTIPSAEDWNKGSVWTFCWNATAFQR